MEKFDRPFSKIVGTGSYVPERVLTNQDLEKIVDTNDEWIVTRTGMKERRIARTDEYTSDMGLAAAKRALEAANLSPDQIDLILFATVTPDYIFPSTACLIQAELGAVKAAAVDVQAACYGLSVWALQWQKLLLNRGCIKIFYLSLQKSFLVLSTTKIAIPVFCLETGRQQP